MVFPVADGHCDFLYGMLQYGYDIASPKSGQVTRLDRLTAGSVAIQFFACWIDTTLRTPPLEQCLMMIDAYERMLAANPEMKKLEKGDTPVPGQVATVLTLEGGEAFDGSTAILRTLKRLGVRAATLTWNENNELAGAALARGNKGLTECGRDIVEALCAENMAVDVSHLSDRGIDDVLTLTDRPVFASHSNARAVYDSPRSLSDAHIREIARRGGTVGVNFYHKQLCRGNAAAIADIVRHIRHIAEVGGVGCAAIGSDFDGMTSYPRDLSSARDFPALAEALLQAGFSESEVRRIFYQNLADYICQFV